MSNATTILVAALAAILGGVVGGATATWMRSETPKPAGSVGSEAPDYDDISTRLEALESQVARLAQQRFTPAAGPIPVPAAPADSGARPASPIDTPVFEAAVRDVIDRMEQDRAAERATRGRERQAQQARRWADRVGEQAGLSEEQKAKVAAIAQEYLSRLREAVQSDGGQLSREERNERRNTLRTESEKRLGEVLSPRQMQAYREANHLQLDSMTRGEGRVRGGQ